MSASYPKPVNGAASWARPPTGSDEAYSASGDLSNFLQDSDSATYVLGPRNQESGFSVDRRLTLICCLVFLGCLLLVVIGTILIHFKRKGQQFGEVSTDPHHGVYRTNPSLSKDSLGSKMEKYRAATLQSPIPYTMGKDNRSVYGVHGQMWSPRLPVGYSEPGLGLICPTNHMMHDPQEQHEQLLRITQAQNMGVVVSDGFDDPNVIQVRPSREEATLQVRQFSLSLLHCGFSM